MKPDALAAQIEADLAAGMKPMCVCATVGTTSTTSSDPLAAIAEVTRKHKVWLHVDAAYAGPATILPEIRPILDGVEHADSLVMNPHKWMFVPVDLSVLYVREPEILRRAFSLVIDILYTPEVGVHNYMDYGLQLGRRFRALKLWFVLRHYGAAEIRKKLRAHIALAQEFAGWVKAEAGWEVSAPHPLSVVCFRYVGDGGTPRANRCAQSGDRGRSERHRRNLHLDDATARPPRPARRDRQRTHHARRRRACVAPDSRPCSREGASVTRGSVAVIVFALAGCAPSPPATCTPQMNARFQESLMTRSSVVEGVSVCGIVSGRPHESGGEHGLHVYIPVRLEAPGGATYITEVIPNEMLDGRIAVHEGDRITALGQFVYPNYRYGYEGLDPRHASCNPSRWLPTVMSRSTERSIDDVVARPAL